MDNLNIYEILEQTKSPARTLIEEILHKAREKNGLDLNDVGYLTNVSDPELLDELFGAASSIKSEIYGERLVFFAPLYVSDFCVNDCAYCNFHASNSELTRKKLTLEEIDEQVSLLINMGHKRILLEAGESPINDLGYIINVINRIYSVRTEKGNIRRVNVNIAATTVDNYRRLKEAKIGTYQLFQETYHRPTYERLHKGPKADYNRQITVHKRAYEAGIDDLGIGVLFGLYDWRFEVLFLIAHSRSMEIGPHTISVPRFKEASCVTYEPEYPVSDVDFFKIIAILRLAVPYTGIIISTRENAKIRRSAFKIGASQASAGSVTTTGGYGKRDKSKSQFNIQDERNLHEVVNDVLKDGLLPSFCTACYRAGRTGKKFMDIAKPGEIHNFCRPNGLLTLAEYCEDFATESVYKDGYTLINQYIEKIENQSIREETKRRLEMVKRGDRDIYF